MDTAVVNRRAMGYGRRYVSPPDARHASADEILRLASASRNDATAQQLDMLASQGARKASTDLYLAGDVSLLERPCVSIIGARQCTEAGAARARRLARELAAQDVVVVSGLAEGIDTSAMTAAIEAGGRTIGVIGTPLTQAYPQSNIELQQEVYRGHLLVSRFAPGSRVFRSNFPERNRLMAMLSSATVVIEASDTSGTLHQATECMRLGRWLFIAQSVVEDRSLQWPAKFLKHPRCRALVNTTELLAAVFG